MSASSSSSSNVSYMCADVILAGYTYSALSWTNILLLLPLSTFVLHLGFHQWRQNRSVSSAAVVSFSAFFTYNLAVMELIGVFGNTVSICSSYAGLHEVMWIGVYIGGFPWFGQMLFPVLTCMEHYLAVVHPLTYLQLRQGRGVRIRNVFALGVWLQCFVGMSFMILAFNFPEFSLLPTACFMVIFLVAVTFFNLSVLYVLSRPRPGRSGGVDESKQKAVHTIMIITAVLEFRFGGNLVCSVVNVSPTVTYSERCVAQAVMGWFNLPSSLVLPLLFLHRAGKLPCCKPSAGPG